MTGLALHPCPPLICFSAASAIGHCYLQNNGAAEPLVSVTVMLIFLNPLNLQQRRSMKNFLVLRVVKCPKRPPRETAKSPSLEVFKEQITQTAVKGSSDICLQAKHWTRRSSGISA